MKLKERVALWDAINEYVITCGGNPSKHVYGNTSRQLSVAKIEEIVREIENQVLENKNK